MGSLSTKNINGNTARTPPQKAASAAYGVGGQHFDGVKSIQHIQREDAEVLRVYTAQPARENAKDREVEHELARRVHAPKGSIIRTGVGIASPHPPPKEGVAARNDSFRGLLLA
jgi:hypothetical protein